MQEFHHVSVLLEKTVQAVMQDPAGIYVDCTLGGAGHAKYLADQLSAQGRFIGIDQDPAALAAGREKLSGVPCQVDLIHSNFSRLGDVLAELGVEKVNGIVFDLGVSSHQLDVAERGFSYQQDAPLDMRMNPQQARSAYDVVNTYEEEELARIIKEFGEERWAKRIASFVATARQTAPIETTGQLVDVIKRAIPAAARRDGPHPAKRTFQAIRIEVNQELEILQGAFRTAIEHLLPGGRLAIITFHSLEDRAAKQALAAAAKGCICPPKLPICMCGHQPQVRLLGKAVTPSEQELENNPRARSAKLRIAEKLGR